MENIQVTDNIGETGNSESDKNIQIFGREEFSSNEEKIEEKAKGLSSEIMATIPD